MVKNALFFSQRQEKNIIIKRDGNGWSKLHFSCNLKTISCIPMTIYLWRANLDELWKNLCGAQINIPDIYYFAVVVVGFPLFCSCVRAMAQWPTHKERMYHLIKYIFQWWKSFGTATSSSSTRCSNQLTFHILIRVHRFYSFHLSFIRSFVRPFILSFNSFLFLTSTRYPKNGNVICVRKQLKTNQKKIEPKLYV